MSKRVAERNQLRVGITGLLVVALLLAGALNIGRLRAALSGVSYEAELAQTGGLRKGDDVRAAGLKVGSVTSVGLAGDHVRVEFTVRDLDLGDRSTLAVKSENALGRKFLAVTPAGEGVAHHIPEERTDAGYAITDAIADVTRTTEQLDVDSLAKSMDTVAETLSGTPEEFRAAVAGVGKLSAAVAARDAELAHLLRRSSGVTDVLARRNRQIMSLIGSGSLVFAEVEARRQVIHSLLVDARGAMEQLSGLVADHRTTLEPSLRELRTAVRLLNKHEQDLDFITSNLGGYARALGESVGSGPWYYAYVANLPPVNILPVARHNLEDFLRGGGDG